MLKIVKTFYNIKKKIKKYRIKEFFLKKYKILKNGR